jgi:hypothetical protein
MRQLVRATVGRLRARLTARDRVTALNDVDVIRLLDQVREAIGRIETQQQAAIRGPLQAHEFKVYSHAGEDGIIQFLISNIAIQSKTFVEFGVEDYREANTRFLLLKDHWTGLVIDGEPANVEKIKADPISWSERLTSVAAFVTRENVNELIEEAGFAGEIGLLSVDVDGNDYWIFEAISAVRPAIAIVEYNHRFGPTRSVTIPYDPGFVRRQTDASWLVCGASLAAVVAAARRKNLVFVGCNSFGNNAFFVRNDLVPSWLSTFSAEEGFVSGRFSEAVCHDGEMVVLDREEEQRVIADATLVQVT